MTSIELKFYVWNKGSCFKVGTVTIGGQLPPWFEEEFKEGWERSDLLIFKPGIELEKIILSVAAKCAAKGDNQYEVARSHEWIQLVLGMVAMTHVESIATA